MTFIVAGKFNNNPFLMVDSVVSGNEHNNGKYYYFKNKLYKLNSSRDDMYFTLSGTAIILDILAEYDLWLIRQDGFIDFESDASFITELKFLLENSIRIDTFSKLDCIDNRL